MHEVLVNRLGGLSLPKKSVVRLTDRPDMTLDVYRGRKTTKQQQSIIGFHFVRAAVACAILERTSGFEPLCETTAPRYLKLVTVPSFCFFTLIFLLMSLALDRTVYKIMLSKRFCSQVNL